MAAVLLACDLNGAEVSGSPAHGAQAIATAQIATEPAASKSAAPGGRILDDLLAAERAGVAGDLAIALRPTSS